MKMDPGVLKKADPPVPPVWRAPTVPAVDLLVANEGRVMVPCQDRSRRKASLYKGPSPGHARPTDGHVGVCPARGCPRETRQSAPGWWVRKMSTPWVHSRERQGGVLHCLAPRPHGVGIGIEPFLAKNQGQGLWAY
jgi:hypothetical protein